MTLRTERVGGQLQEEIARMLLMGEIKDPRLSQGVVSVTEVKVSRDLQEATIYISVHGADGAKALQALTHATGFLRGQLARRLRMRLAPNLHFLLDSSLERADQISRLIASLNIPKEDDAEAEDGTRSQE